LLFSVPSIECFVHTYTTITLTQTSIGTWHKYTQFLVMKLNNYANMTKVNKDFKRHLDTVYPHTNTKHNYLTSNQN